MNENEGGLKRTKQEAPYADNENKRHKLNKEEITIPTVPATLVLDKSQQETIQQLLQSSHISAQEVKLVEQETHLLEPEDNNNMEVEIVSADVTKPVTATPNTPSASIDNNVALEKSNSATEDASITSEQLLFALTSAPPTETATNQQAEESGEVAEKLTVSDQSTVPEKPVSVHPAHTVTPVPEIKVPSPEPSSVTGLGITPKVSTTPLPQSQPKASGQKPNPPQTSNVTYSTSTSIPTPAKASNNDNNSPSLTNATSMTLTNLPDISAALRRLSSANVSASVIEQLSSSPRLPNIGQLSERKGSITDVSPSEILGNALAAVAANAAAVRSSSPMPNNTNSSTQQTSPKQSHQQLQSQQQPQGNNVQATATAIGNLAAITANISNFLHSGGFHRNSFSQEDTQKLAAAVAVARNSQQQQPSGQRRKSSMAVVGNAFSNMLDQAMMMGRNKSISEGGKASQYTASSSSVITTGPSQVHSVAKEAKPKLIIKNDQVWKSLEGMEEKTLGYHLYSPHLLLPNLESSINGLLEIRVPATFLTFENTRVQKRALWGTDIYTDDSDIVAMAIHSGKYRPPFIEPTIESGDPFALAVAGKQRESIEAAKRLALSGKKYIHRYNHLKPDHDLKVTVRVLPTLQQYASSIRYKLKSREWGKHDGMSLYVHKVEKIKRGDARLKGRSTLKSNMFAYESYRKQALGLSSLKQVTLNDKKGATPPLIPHVQKGRVKKTPRVMRMFQIRSEMMRNNQEPNNS